MADTLDELNRSIYYLKSIRSNLRDVRILTRRKTSIATEVLSDNIDWIDCYIDKLERQVKAELLSQSVKRGEYKP